MTLNLVAKDMHTLIIYNDKVYFFAKTFKCKAQKVFNICPKFGTVNRLKMF